MQRGAQSARRHFGGVVLPTYVFQYIFKKSRSHAAWGGPASSSARSHATFSNTLNATVFVVLHLGRSGALFFDSPWPSVAVRSITCSPVFPFWRSGALFSSTRRAPFFGFGRRLGWPWVAFWVAGSGRHG